MRRLSRRRPRSPVAGERPRRRRSWARRSATCGRAPTGSSRRRSFRSRPSRFSRSTPRSSADARSGFRPNRDFSFPLDARARRDHARARASCSSRARTTRPGVVTPLDAIRAVAATLPPGAIVFVDEAYAEFSESSFIPELDRFPNVIVGRTFSKAFGLAGLRIGAITGHPDALEPIRLAVPVYSVNIAAVVAVQAALDDLEYLREYAAQVEQSKTLLYAACDRLGLRYWKSAANFVLIDAGARAAPCWRAARRRAASTSAIDRREPGCDGCLRVGSRHRRTHAALHSTYSRRFCAPRGNRPTDDRNADRALAHARRARHVRRPHRHPVSRSHAGAVRAARRVRPDGQGHRRPRRRPASHRRRPRHRARRSRVEGARRSQGHQSRRLLRDADGRNAGRRGDRSRRPAAHRRRPEGEGAAASAICRPSSCTTSSRASRSARAPTCTSR